MLFFVIELSTIVEGGVGGYYGEEGVGWRLGNSLSFVLPNLCKYTKCYCPD